MSMLDRSYRSLVHRRLAGLAVGRIVLADAGTHHTFGQSTDDGVRVDVLDQRFYGAVALGGHVGAAEAYVSRWWDTDDLTGVIRLFLRNRSALDGLETGWARLVQPLRAVAHTLNRNTRRGSRRNIQRHYDLSNQFFRHLLDDTMTYSCGFFEQPEDSMRSASVAKYERLCRKLDLSRNDHVVEIGTGWGGFAIHAAQRYGCRITTTTISQEQFTLARERIAAEGLRDQVTVLNCDYRDLTGTYDKLVSIEMIEAVGHHYYASFFGKCASLLASHGSAAIQTITIQDRFYESARREIDFIKRYIFPGSCIPAVSVLCRAAATTDLRLVHAEDIGPHYAETLRRWRANFDRHWAAIADLGFTDEFRRLWTFYLCYCEGGFAEGTLGDAQLVFAKPDAGLTLEHPRESREAAA